MSHAAFDAGLARGERVGVSGHAKKAYLIVSEEAQL